MLVRSAVLAELGEESREKGPGPNTIKFWLSPVTGPDTNLTEDDFKAFERYEKGVDVELEGTKSSQCHGGHGSTDVTGKPLNLLRTCGKPKTGSRSKSFWAKKFPILDEHTNVIVSTEPVQTYKCGRIGRKDSNHVDGKDSAPCAEGRDPSAVIIPDRGFSDSQSDQKCTNLSLNQCQCHGRHSNAAARNASRYEVSPRESTNGTVTTRKNGGNHNADGNSAESSGSDGAADSKNSKRAWTVPFWVCVVFLLVFFSVVLAVLVWDFISPSQSSTGVQRSSESVYGDEKV